MWKTACFIIYVLVFTNQAKAELHIYLKNVDQLKAIVEELKTQNDFAPIQSIHIEYKAEPSDMVFFSASIKKSTLLGSRDNRSYILSYAPQIFQRKLSLGAAKGVLAHELAHFLDYSNRNFFQMIWLAVEAQVTDHREYEREIDRVVVSELNMGEELIQFREWLYRQLTPRQVEIKKTVYLTPREIKILKKE